jgi:hypothetical protein
MGRLARRDGAGVGPGATPRRRHRQLPSCRSLIWRRLPPSGLTPYGRSGVDRLGPGTAIPIGRFFDNRIMIAEEQVAGRVFPAHAGMNRSRSSIWPIPVAAKVAAMPAAVDDRSMARPAAVSLIATSAMSTSISARVARPQPIGGEGGDGFRRAGGPARQARRRPQQRHSAPFVRGDRFSFFSLRVPTKIRKNSAPDRCV